MMLCEIRFNFDILLFVFVDSGYQLIFGVFSVVGSAKNLIHSIITWQKQAIKLSGTIGKLCPLAKLNSLFMSTACRIIICMMLVPA